MTSIAEVPSPDTTMKSSILSASLLVPSCCSVAAFGPSRASRLVRHSVVRHAYVDTSEHAQRDTNALLSWCDSYGVQRSGAIDYCPTASFKYNHDATDLTCYALEDLPAGTSVLNVPASLVLHSYNIQHGETGTLVQAEEFLTKLREPLAPFYLFVKLLYEYSAGDASPYYDWLNALPRTCDAGASMTPVCYECLPPLAGTYAKMERVRYINYRSAAKTIEWLPEWIIEDLDVCKWAFNAVSTRSWGLGDGTDERVMVPLGDMVRERIVHLS